MSRKNTLKGFGGLVIAFSVIGCGGSDSSISSSSRRTTTVRTSTNTTSVPGKGFNYPAELSKAPKIIQDAMNSQPIQLIDDNFLEKLGTRAYSSNTINVAAKPTVNGTQGYSFVTVKVDNNTINEAVYAWQKDIDLYSVASRQICYNATKSKFEFSRDFVSELNNELKGSMSITLARGIADFLSLSSITLDGKAQFIGDKIFLSEVNYTLLGQKKSMKDFNVLNNDSGIFMALLAVYGDFLGSQ